MLQNEYLVVKIGFDTGGSEPCKVCVLSLEKALGEVALRRKISAEFSSVSAVSAPIFAPIRVFQHFLRSTKFSS